MARRTKRSIEAFRIAEHCTSFVNNAFTRRLGKMGPSFALVDAVQEALDSGYTEDQIRICYWSARCTQNWLREQLSGTIQPEIALRHKGSMNTITGKPAVRWLDDLVERVGEINPRVAYAVLKSLPESMQKAESELLVRAGVSIEQA